MAVRLIVFTAARSNLKAVSVNFYETTFLPYPFEKSLSLCLEKILKCFKDKIQRVKAKLRRKANYSSKISF